VHRRKKLTTVHLEELYDAKLEEDLSSRTVTGGHLRPQTLYTKYFLPARERAGLPPIHFHDLRHTYAHVLPGMQKAAGEAMDRVLFGSE
jgi:integrase